MSLYRWSYCYIQDLTPDTRPQILSLRTLAKQCLGNRPSKKTLSQTVMNDTPKNRLRVPPNSATREVQGNIKVSVSTRVSLDEATKENTKALELKVVVCMSPTIRYLWYRQGLLQYVSFMIVIGSAFIRLYLSSNYLKNIRLKEYCQPLYHVTCTVPFPCTPACLDHWACLTHKVSP